MCTFADPYHMNIPGGAFLLVQYHNAVHLNLVPQELLALLALKAHRPGARARPGLGLSRSLRYGKI